MRIFSLKNWWISNNIWFFIDTPLNQKCWIFELKQSSRSQPTQTGPELDGLSWALIWIILLSVCLVPRAVFSDPSLCRDERGSCCWSDQSCVMFVFKYQQVKCDRKLSLSADGRAHTGFLSSLLLSSSPSVPLCRWWRLPGWWSVSEQGPRGHGPGPGGHQEAAAVPHGAAGQPQQGHVQ